MSLIIDGDITQIMKGLIVHQCNCQGVMGAGVALSIAKKFPKALEGYKQAHREGQLVLGNVVITPVTDDLSVAHLCGQDYYGRGQKIYTNYQAVRLGMKVLNISPYQDIYIPYGMGCGLAGGDWTVVSNTIDCYCKRAVIVKFSTGFQPG